MSLDQNKPLPPNAKEYLTLCQRAREIQLRKPWKFLAEKDLFGVQTSEDGEILFVSIMRTGLTIARGVEGLYGWKEFYQTLENSSPTDDPVILLRSISLLQLDFDSGALLEEHDHEVIRNSGVQFSGGWPQFRSQRPGCYPWLITRDEALLMICALEQTIELAKVFPEDVDAIRLHQQPGNHQYLVRTPVVNDGEITWRSSLRSIDPLPAQLVPFAVDDTLLGRLQQLPISNPQEVDVFVLPVRLGDSKERQRVLFCFMAANSITGYLFVLEPLEAPDGIDLMYAELAERLGASWVKHDLVPGEVYVRSKKVHEALRGLMEELKIPITLVKDLPAIVEAKVAIEKRGPGRH